MKIVMQAEDWKVYLYGETDKDREELEFNVQQAVDNYLAKGIEKLVQRGCKNGTVREDTAYTGTFVDGKGGEIYVQLRLTRADSSAPVWKAEAVLRNTYPDGRQTYAGMSSKYVAADRAHDFRGKLILEIDTD